MPRLRVTWQTNLTSARGRSVGTRHRRPSSRRIRLRTCHRTRQANMNDRRQFLQMLSTALLTPFVLSSRSAGQEKSAAYNPISAKPSKIPLAFSTLGCPGWEWPKILVFAQQHGFAAIELRGVGGKLDLPALPLFAADRIKQTQSEIRDHKLKIACVSSSAQMYVDDPAKRA